MTHLATEIKGLAVSPGRLAIFWLGGAGFVFKAASGPVVAVDPYLSDSLDHNYAWKRLPLSPIPLLPAELGADLVLATHADEDHLVPETIPDLARTSERFSPGRACAPRRCAPGASRTIGSSRSTARAARPGGRAGDGGVGASRVQRGGANAGRGGFRLSWTASASITPATRSIIPTCNSARVVAGGDARVHQRRLRRCAPERPPA